MYECPHELDGCMSIYPVGMMSQCLNGPDHDMSVPEKGLNMSIRRCPGSGHTFKCPKCGLVC